ncbi:MAG: transposase [Actinomycetota bacterium]
MGWASQNKFLAFGKAAHTLACWRGEILAHFTVPVANAYAEGVTNKIMLKRTA